MNGTCQPVSSVKDAIEFSFFEDVIQVRLIVNLCVVTLAKPNSFQISQISDIVSHLHKLSRGLVTDAHNYLTA